MGTEQEQLLDQARELAAGRSLEQALVLYRDLCERDPYDPEPWLERAGVAEAAGLIQEAIRALFHVAELYGRTGMGEAVDIALRVLALDAEHRGALQFLSLHAPDRLVQTLGGASAVPQAIPRFDAIPVAEPLADALPMPVPVSESMAMPQPVLEPVSGPLSGPVASAVEPVRPPGQRTRRLVTELVRGLKNSPLVQELDPDAIAFLAEAGQPRRCVRGQVVFREGEEGDSLFLVLEGAVDVERRQPATGAVVRLSTLPVGAFFGEVSVVAGVPRSATVRARERTILLEVSRASMRELGSRHEQVLVTLMRFFRARLVGTLMATSPLFQPFTSDERRALVSRFRLRELKPNEIVLRQGRVGDSLYVVLIGTLIAFATDEQGNTHTLGVLEPGEVFGEMSLIHGERAMASIGAHSRAWLLRLPRGDFDEIVAMHPEVLAQLAGIAADRAARNRDILTGG